MKILTAKNRSGYNSLHEKNLRNYPKLSICLDCGKDGKTDWANISGNYYDVREDWVELCRQCHKDYDGAISRLKTYQWLDLSTLFTHVILPNYLIIPIIQSDITRT